MTLLESLVEAIVRLEGDALVMHVGEKPYVLTPASAMSPYRGPLAWGQVEVSSRVLTHEALLDMLTQMVPGEHRESLDALGAVEVEVPETPAIPGRFAIVAAKGGEDIWLEVRRVRIELPQPEASQAAAPMASTGAADAPPAIAHGTPVLAPEPEDEAPFVLTGDPPSDDSRDRMMLDEAVMESLVTDALLADQMERFDWDVPEVPALHAIETVQDWTPLSDLEPLTPMDHTPLAAEAALDAPHADGIEIVHEEPQVLPSDDDVEALMAATASALLMELEPVVPAAAAPVAPQAVPALPVAEPPAVPAAASGVPLRPTEDTPPHPAATERTEVRPAEVPARAAASIASGAAPREPIVETAARPTPVAGDAVPAPADVRPAGDDRGSSWDRSLRAAAARGASVLYAVAQSRPVARIDGEIVVLDEEPVLSNGDIAAMIQHLSSSRGESATPSDSGEWFCDVQGVGRVRYLTFHDHRGAGIILRLLPLRAISAEHLGLPAPVQGLCNQPDGLVLVTGVEGSGKSTLLNAFIELINAHRSDYVITIESRISFVHQNQRSFISQRELSGEAVAPAIREALHEDPDVLFIDDLASPEIVAGALEAAESGRLVFGAVQAASIAAALEQLVGQAPTERRAQIRASLAASLRGVVSQVLLRKVKGGRVAAREVLLNGPAVATLLGEGKTTQLAAVLDAGRRQGMMPLTDSLTALVREGAVHIGEAYRKAVDRDALLTALKREGIDTSFAERLA